MGADTGAGGKGTATQGIAGVGTKGRGSGQGGYGGSEGFGDKGAVSVEPGGAEEDFVGTIDKEAVRRVVRANIKEIQFCYERQLQGNKSLEGKVLIEWEIGAQGAVLTTKLLKTSVSNAAVENCVMTRIKSWKFPEPPPNTVAVVQYPFNFVNNTR